ncbi:MAG: tyrosine-type recombinase/integrase [Lachnospiraceae bacterium]|nr:tyrosine-type recombinase/integrase [Lachnospiraceae bacterium]
MGNAMDPVKGTDNILDFADVLLEKPKVGKRNYVLFMTGIYLGRRISDLLKLRVRDVKGKNKVYFRESKKGKEFNLVINKELKEIYSDYCKDKKDHEFLFQSSRCKTPKHITRQMCWKIFKEAGEQLGYDDKIGCHSLKKTLGRKLYDDGVDIGLIMHILGHDDINYTKRYIGVTGDEMNRALEVVSYRLHR